MIVKIICVHESLGRLLNFQIGMLMFVKSLQLMYIYIRIHEEKKSSNIFSASTSPSMLNLNEHKLTTLIDGTTSLNLDVCYSHADDEDVTKFTPFLLPDRRFFDLRDISVGAVCFTKRWKSFLTQLFIQRPICIRLQYTAAVMVSDITTFSTYSVALKLLQ